MTPDRRIDSLSQSEKRDVVARSYVDLLDLLHESLRPRTYVEIGVGWGRSLALAHSETTSVGIDPRPKLRTVIPVRTRIFRLTSDEFFESHDLNALLDGLPVDLAFIDGMHLFEFALRDFIHLERAARPGSVIAIHDCSPPNAEVATRERVSRFWTGDVWKLIPCLRERRPDLTVCVVDAPPSGLGLVTGLDPTSGVLEAQFAEICERFAEREFDEAARGALELIPPAWTLIAQELGLPADLPDLDGRRAERKKRDKQKPESRQVSKTSVLVLDADRRQATEIKLHDYPPGFSAKLEDMAESLEFRSDTPGISHVHDVTYFPRLGALYDQEGRRILSTCLRRGPKLEQVVSIAPETVDIPAGLATVSQPVIYGGLMKPHWGLFLTEGIARLWALRESTAHPEAPLLFRGAESVSTPFISRFLEHAGLDLSRILDLRAPTRLAHVMVPEPSFALQGYTYACHADLPLQVARSAGCTATRRSDQPVYLSRSKVAERRAKRQVDETALEKLLEGAGVAVVSPETLPFEEQIGLFNRHSTFIGRIGSALHSVLYALPGERLRTAVISNKASAFFGAFFLIDELKSIDAHYLYDPAGSKGAAEGALDANAIAARLGELGFI